METPLVLVLGLLIVALIVTGVLLRGWVRRRAAVAGRRAGARFTSARMREILDELGATLVIRASPAVAADLLRAAAAARGKDFTRLADGDIGIRFVETDDTIVRVAPDPAGALLRVETFRDYLGFPQTAPQWKELRALVTAEAAAHGIAVTDGPASAFERGPLLDDRNARWTRLP